MRWESWLSDGSLKKRSGEREKAFRREEHRMSTSKAFVRKVSAQGRWASGRSLEGFLPRRGLLPVAGVRAHHLVSRQVPGISRSATPWVRWAGAPEGGATCGGRSNEGPGCEFAPPMGLRFRSRGSRAWRCAAARSGCLRRVRRRRWCVRSAPREGRRP